jgi:DNA-binding GntR family transcriptional regulator
MSRKSTDLGHLERLDVDPPLYARVHTRLEALIVGRVLHPGARIAEGDLAERMGVSRGPIREALQILARDGFVDLRPRQGAFVHVPTAKEIADFFNVRRALEVESAALAADRVQPDQAKELYELIDIASAMLESGSDPTAQRDRAGMHAKIAEIAGNPLLARMLSTLGRRSDWYSPPFEVGTRRKAWMQHRDIADAIAAQDRERAVAMMSKHIDGSRDRFYASLEHNDIEAS